MAAKKKKRRNAFKKGLRIYMILLTTLAGILLVVLWSFLARYQHGVDAENAARIAREEQAAHELAVSRAPQNALEDFLRTADASYWARQWFASHPESFDDEDKVRAYMDELFRGDDVRCWKAEDYSADSPRYILKKDRQPLAHLTLSGSGLNWSVTQTEILFDGSAEGSVLVPEGYAVSCNGHPLDSSYCVGESRLYDMADYADLIVDPVQWLTYTVSGQLFEPEFTTQAPADRLTVTDSEGNVFYILSGQEAEAYQQRAERFIYSLLYYYMNGSDGTYGHMWDTLSHVATYSQAYNLIRDSYIGVIWDTAYYNATYQADAAEVRILASNCLMVDVKYHTEGSAMGYANSADGTYRVYFLDRGSGYEIYGLFYV